MKEIIKQFFGLNIMQFVLLYMLSQYFACTSYYKFQCAILTI